MSNSSPTSNTINSKIVFIEDNVGDLDILLGSVKQGLDVVVLDSTRDGLAQIAEYLSARTGIEEVHVVSHGSEGRINLGAVDLTSANLEAYASTLSEIGKSLSESADLLFYSCDFAKSPEGQSALSMLARLTGADIAASSDITGGTAVGGNWVLEAATGTISARLPFEERVAEEYRQTLGTINIDPPGVSAEYTATSGADLFVVPATASSYNGNFVATGGWMYNNNTWYFENHIIVVKNFDVSFDKFDLTAVTDIPVNTNYSIKTTSGGNFIQEMGYGPQVVVEAAQYDAAAHRIGNTFSAVSGTFIYLYEEFGEAVFSAFVTGVTPAQLSLSNFLFPGQSANQAPALGGTFSTNGSANDNATYAPFSGVTYSDSDGGSYTVKISYTAANGTLTGTGLTGSAGNYTVTGSTAADVQGKLNALVFTPTVNQVAPGSNVQTTFTLTPNDGTIDGTANSTSKVTVLSINDAPTLSAISTLANGNEDTAYTITYAALAAAANEADADTGTTLSFRIAAVSSGTLNKNGTPVTSGSTTLGVGESLVWTPAAESSGTINAFTVKAYDGGLESSSAVQVKVDVASVNDIPSITNLDGDTISFVPGSPDQSNDWVDSQYGSDLPAGFSDPDFTGAGRYLTIHQTTTTPKGNFFLWMDKFATDSGMTKAEIAAGEGVYHYADTTTPIGYVDAAKDGQDGHDLVIHFSSSITSSVVDELLGSLMFNAPDAGEYTFELNVWDGTAYSNTATFTARSPVVVTSVSASNANAKYKIGDTITVEVTFDRAVEVNTNSGANKPVLKLETGTTDRDAVYAGGSGTNKLSFTYVVQSGDVATDLDFTATTALGLNSGEIKDAATGYAAILTLPTPGAPGSLGANKAIVVDGLAPSDIALSAASLSTSASANTEVGTLSTTDATSSDSFTYTLVSGTGATNNGAFTIVGNSLRATDPGSLTPGANSVRVRTTDAAGNTYEEALSITVTTNPTVTITADKASVKVGETATVTFTFSETPTGFAADDITVTGGTGSLTGITVDGGDNKIYHGTFTPTTETQSVSSAISVAAGSFKNASNQDNLVSNTLTINGDTLVPTVTSIDRQTPASDKTNADSLIYRVTFSEAVSHVSTSDFTVTGTTATVTNVSSAGGNAYDVTVAGGDLGSFNGTVTLDFAAGQDITDTAGNALTSLAPTGTNQATYTLDNTIATPVMALANDSGSSNSDRITKDGTVNVTLADDVASWEYSVNSGSSWTAGAGTSFLLAAGTYSTGSVRVRQTDAAGNTSTAASNASSITVDTSVAAPSFVLTSDTGSGTSDGITANGQVNVTGLEAGASWEYSTDGGSGWSTGNGTAFTLTAGSYAAGSVRVRQTDVAGNVSSVTDNAGPLLIDPANPTVASVTRATLVQPSGTDSFTIGVTYADVGSGLDSTTLGTSDITVTGPGAIGTLAVTGVGYNAATKTATYTVAAPGGGWNAGAHAGAYIIGLNNAEVKDLAGNSVAANAAAHTFNVSFNAIPQITSNGGLATANVSIAEATTAVTTVTATDADTTDTVTYSITGGADSAKFAINTTTGQLGFLSAPLVASPTDTGADNVYDVEVTASDGRGGNAVQALAVTVLADKDRDGTPNTADPDIDGDGLLNSAEDPVPSAYPLNPPGVIGDGNGDGFSDAEQIHVASIATPNASSSVAVAKRFATLEVDGNQGYTITNVSNTATPSAGLPRSVKMPLGVFDFTIENVTPGGTATVSLYVDKTLGFNGYYKQDNDGNWQKLGTVTTVGEKTKVTFSLTDGGIYDADKTVNGVIVDPGGGVVVTPLIISNGGTTTPLVNVQEGSTAVTTVSAQAVGTVSYAVTGGADQAKFAVNATTGALSFVAAPDYENPQDLGDTAGNNTYMVEVTASDEHGSDVQMLTVKVGDVDETPPAPPTKLETVDGVTLQTGTKTNDDGSVQKTIVIPVVAPTRPEEVGNNTVADIPLVKSNNGEAVLMAQVPTGIGMEVSGMATAKPAGTSVTDLIREIKAHTEADSRDQTQLTGGGSGFLQSLPADVPLLVQTIVPTAAPNSSAPAEPLVISSKPTTPGSELTALVIDARSLPSGTEIQLQNVEFAAVIGAIRVTGGDGSQNVWGDGSAQYIMLGADDDVLHGGAGDDTVGSAGGNDQIFGDEGNDIVFGGLGNDAIDGGTGIDKVELIGRGRSDYHLQVQNGKLVMTHRNGGSDGVDTVANVETLRFTGTEDMSTQSVVNRLYDTLFDRAPDQGGKTFWADAIGRGVSLHDVAAQFLASAEGQQLRGAMSNTQYVDALYSTSLNRQADAAGRSYWIDLLDKGKADRADVLLSFANSKEKQAMEYGAATELDFNQTDVAAIVRMYDSLFDRRADEGGLNFWINASEAGASLNNIAAGFLSSQEARHSFMPMSNTQFVEHLYQAALGRQGSSKEVAEWAAQLDSGALGRNDVLAGFANSAEKIALVGVMSTSIVTL